MSQDDSDISDGDNDSFTTTNILLGYASRDPTNDDFSQLGGRPTWPDPNNPPSAALARCKNCNAMLILLLQLLADLPDHFPGHERRLYLFSCMRKACRRKNGSVRAFRGTKVVTDSQKEKGRVSVAQRETVDESNSNKPAQIQPVDTPRLGDSIFNSTFKPAGETQSNPFAKSTSQAPSNNAPQGPPANPFATSSPTSSAENPFNGQTPPQNSSTSNQAPPPNPTSLQDLAATFAEKARISPLPQQQHSKQPAPPQPIPWPPATELPTPYPSYHLDADIETLDPTPFPSSLSNPNPTLDTDPTSNEPPEKEAFESHLDRTFQKFADRVAQNPEQVLRYEYGGQPLLYSSTDAVGKLFASKSDAETAGMSGVKVVGRGGGGGRGGMPSCGNCGAGRVFECQLMPGAISTLEAEEEGLDGMEWGSVVVGVCGRDCGGGRGEGEGEWRWREEWCGVQWEEVK